MRRIASCETFRRTRKTTQPVLPTLPEKGISDTEVLLLLTSLQSLTNLHVFPQTKALSWKVLCKESKTEPPNISTTGLFTRKHCQQYASNFNQILLLPFF
jgi:hypothetical protein